MTFFVKSRPLQIILALVAAACLLVGVGGGGAAFPYIVVAGGCALWAFSGYRVRVDPENCEAVADFLILGVTTHAAVSRVAVSEVFVVLRMRMEMARFYVCVGRVADDAWVSDLEYIEIGVHDRLMWPGFGRAEQQARALATRLGVPARIYWAGWPRGDKDAVGDTKKTAKELATPFTNRTAIGLGGGILAVAAILLVMIALTAVL